MRSRRIFSFAAVTQSCAPLRRRWLPRPRMRTERPRASKQLPPFPYRRPLPLQRRRFALGASQIQFGRRRRRQKAINIQLVAGVAVVRLTRQAAQKRAARIVQSARSQFRRRRRRTSAAPSIRPDGRTNNARYNGAPPSASSFGSGFGSSSGGNKLTIQLKCLLRADKEASIKSARSSHSFHLGGCPSGHFAAA